LEPRESHYSRESNPNKLFLPSGTTKKQLHQNFIHENQQFNPHVHEYEENLSYFSFLKIFNDEFNISVGYPRSDLCHICELLNKRECIARRSASEDEVRQIQEEQIAHWTMADRFYATMREAKNLDDSHLVICCDYEKNFSLPITGVNKQYFSSDMNVYNFGIHDLRSQQTTLYFYPENFAHKGSNEINSFLMDFVSSVENTMRHLILFMDNSCGQNKNRYMFAICQFLASTRFETVKIIFPQPGHSFMPIDREFAILEKKRKKMDRVIKPSDWVTFLRNAKERNPFVLKYVQFPFTDDLQTDGTPIVTVKDFKASMDPLFLSRIPVAAIREIRFRNQTDPVVICPETNFETPLRMYKRGFTQRNLQTRIRDAKDAYNRETFLAIRENSANSVHTLLEYVDLPANVTFYNSIQA